MTQDSSCRHTLLIHQTCPLVTFNLFPKLKEYLRGNKHGDDDEVMFAVNDWLDEQANDFFFSRKSKHWNIVEKKRW